jgi:hypothetical protein
MAPSEKGLHHPLEAWRIVQEDVMVGMRDFGENEERTTGFGFSNELGTHP